MTTRTATAIAAVILAAACARGDGLKPLRNAIMQSDGNMAGYSWTNGTFSGNLAGSTNYTELDPSYATGGVTRAGLTVGTSNAPAGTLFWDAATMTLRGGTQQVASASGLTNVAAAVGSGNVVTQVLAANGQVVPYLGTITGGGGADDSTNSAHTAVALTCAPTVTLARANGPWVTLTATQAVVLAGGGTNDFASGLACYATMDLLPNNNAVTFDGASVRQSSLMMYYGIPTSGVVRLTWHRPANSNIWLVAPVDTLSIAQGGDISVVGGYRIHTFTNSGTLTVSGPLAVDYLIVAGGGAGGYSSAGNSYAGGGGGAGGALTGATTLASGAYSIVVGAGGSASASTATAGSNSTALGFTAIGGGQGAYGALVAVNGGNGGSGGASTDAGTAGTGTAGQGRDGALSSAAYGSSGGGGGYGAVGTGVSGVNGGAGGVGLTTSISGSSVTYAGGGGGGGYNSGATGGSGGSGGGGSGGGCPGGTRAAGSSGTAGRGGGGGGSGAAGSGSAASGGAGGSGIVIVRYAWAGN